MRLLCYKTFRIVVILISLISARSTFAASSPQAVVNEFYKYHFAHDMGFTPETLKDRQSWLTPNLILVCRTYFAIPQNPDEAPFINGDPFTGTQEYPEKFSLGSAKVSKSEARIDIIFHWKETDPRKATVVLKKLNRKWLIDDVEFPDQESLRQLLAGATKG